MGILETWFGWTGLVPTPFERATRGMTPRELRGAEGKVLVAGRVHASASPLRAPFADEACVLWAASHAERATTTVHQRGGEREVVVWREHFRSVGVTSFELVDATGGAARVEVPRRSLRSAGRRRVRLRPRRGRAPPGAQRRGVVRAQASRSPARRGLRA